MDQDVEIGLHTLNKKNGKCSIKVWLYRGNALPTYFIRFN
jgi:ribosomal protein S3